jgi:hypothetical protein
LARWDADGDGNVTLTQLPVWLQTRKKAADTNADGVLSRDEIQADCAASPGGMGAGRGGPGSGAARHAARFAASDTDGDGALTEQEVGARRWARLRVADRNGDGKVTQQEADQALSDGTLTPRGGGGRNGR